MKNKSNLSAFTLIELLIVIAIIGILATLMFPAIQGALNKANGVKIGNNGANIVKQIISANIEREANAKGAIWPSKDNWQTSNEYFAKLMGEGGGRVLLDGISFAAFAGAGVAAASDATELKSEGNIWTALGGIESCDDATPFLWTRNLLLTETDFLTADPSVEDGEWADKLGTEEAPMNKPFGDKQVVIVRRGGAMATIEAKTLSSYNFLQVSNDTSKISILKTANESASGGESEF